MKGRIATILFGVLLAIGLYCSVRPQAAPVVAQPVPAGQVRQVRQLSQPAVAPMQVATSVPVRLNSTNASRTASQWGAGGSRAFAAAALTSRCHQLRHVTFMLKARLGAMPFYCSHPRDYFVIALREIIR